MKNQVANIFLLFGVFYLVVVSAAINNVDSNPSASLNANNVTGASYGLLDLNATLALQAYLLEHNISFADQDALSVSCSSPRRVLSRTITALKDDSCKNLDLDYAISEIKGKIYFNGEFCYWASDNWHLKTRVQLTIFGFTLVDENDTFSPEHYEISKDVNVGLAKANLTIGVYGKCLKIKGNGCYWTITSWNCADFDETLFCF